MIPKSTADIINDWGNCFYTHYAYKLDVYKRQFLARFRKQCHRDDGTVADLECVCSGRRLSACDGIYLGR